MWNAAIVFSNEDHGLQQKSPEKSCFFSVPRLCKTYWIIYCAHMTSHANRWVDETADVMPPINRSIKVKIVWILFFK